MKKQLLEQILKLSIKRDEQKVLKEYFRINNTILEMKRKLTKMSLNKD